MYWKQVRKQLHVLYCISYSLHLREKHVFSLLTIFYSFQVDTAMTESVVTVDWENGFVESSAKDNLNVSKVFKELLCQAKVKYNLSPALRRRRRQSLPSQAGPPSTPSSSPHPTIPSALQLQHLQQIRDRHGKRNSCVIS